MAPIGNSLPSIGSNPTTPSSSSSASPSSKSTDPTAALGNTGTFLQLLVAQLKNQDPSQPQDGTQFVSQLAQFSNLEQTIGMKTDLDSINAKYTNAATGATGKQGTQSGTNPTQKLQ